VLIVYYGRKRISTVSHKNIRSSLEEPAVLKLMLLHHMKQGSIRNASHLHIVVLAFGQLTDTNLDESSKQWAANRKIGLHISSVGVQQDDR
jgi:hypothetical protein